MLSALIDEGTTQMPKPRDLLILKYDDFQRDTAHFFVELHKDEAVRDLLFSNPSLVLRTKFPSLSNVSVSDHQDEVANKILYSVLTNEQFKNFLREYQQKKSAAVARLLEAPDDKEAANALDERTVRLEIAEALLQFGDKELVSNLFDSSGAIRGGVVVSWWLIVIAVIIIAVAAAVHTLLALGTSGDFAPTARGRPPIPASALRKIADQLVAAARKARDSGQLA
jgi:hypothetical protein